MKPSIWFDAAISIASALALFVPAIVGFAAHWATNSAPISVTAALAATIAGMWWVERWS